MRWDLQLIVLREHSFFRREGGPEEFWGGSLTFCTAQKGRVSINLKRGGSP